MCCCCVSLARQRPYAWQRHRGSAAGSVARRLAPRRFARPPLPRPPACQRMKSHETQSRWKAFRECCPTSTCRLSCWRRRAPRRVPPRRRLPPRGQRRSTAWRRAACMTTCTCSGVWGGGRGWVGGRRRRSMACSGRSRCRSGLLSRGPLGAATATCLRPGDPADLAAAARLSPAWQPCGPWPQPADVGAPAAAAFIRRQRGGWWVGGGGLDGGGGDRAVAPLRLEYGAVQRCSLVSSHRHRHPCPRCPQFCYPLRQHALPAPAQQLALNRAAAAGWDSCLWHSNLPTLAARSGTHARLQRPLQPACMAGCCLRLWVLGSRACSGFAACAGISAPLNRQWHCCLTHHHPPAAGHLALLQLAPAAEGSQEEEEEGASLG